MSALAGFHHVKLPVSNVERSRAWYQRVLDLVRRCRPTPTCSSGGIGWTGSASRTAASLMGHIGWVIAGVHDPDGIEVRLYTVERHDGQ